MKRVFFKKAIVSFAAAIACSVAEAEPALMPLKSAAPTSHLDWTGFYVGGHFGYVTGMSQPNTIERGANASAASGTIDLFNAYDPFKGTGSYIIGLQAGFNHMFPSNVLVGIEADFSSPNTVTGNQTVFSTLSGQRNFSEKVLQSGTVRGRLGYVFDQFLAYGTGGVAWTYDKLERTQLSGIPADINVNAGTTDTAFLWRWGWAAGAGLEYAITPDWSAKFEYLATNFGTREKGLSRGSKPLDSNLSAQSLRLGVNYQLGPDLSKSDAFTKGVRPLDGDIFSVHGQTTLVSQYALRFRAPYAGLNSLASNSGRETLDVDLYLGFRPWQGAEIWINPEIDQGFGLSGTFGVAAFPVQKPIKSVLPIRMREFHAHFFVRQSILAATS